MAMVDELGGSAMAGVTTAAQKGCFVMWQMAPNKWLIELVVEGHKVVAGSDGNVAWRHTPWLGSHAAKGGVRPLRRALQASGTNQELFHFCFACLVNKSNNYRCPFGYLLINCDLTLNLGS